MADLILFNDRWARLSAEQLGRYADRAASPGTTVWARAVSNRLVQVSIMEDGHDPNRANLFGPHWQAITGGLDSLQIAFDAAMRSRHDKMVKVGRWPETRTGRNL